MKVTELFVVSSKEIKNPKQLKELFRDGCAIQIDDRVYTTAKSILEVAKVLEDLTNAGVDNDIATEEFVGMWAMALSIAEPEKYKALVTEFIEESGNDISINEAEEQMLEELEEFRNASE